MAGSVLLRVPATLAYRQLACRTVSAVCKLSQDQVGIGSSTAARRSANELMSAVGEAFNNVVVHGYSNSGDGDVELELDWDAEQVVVEMRDNGASFDLDAVPPLDLDAPHEGGMGVHIIRSFADHVVYRAGPPNVLLLTKTMRGGQAQVHAAACQPRRSRRSASG